MFASASDILVLIVVRDIPNYYAFCDCSLCYLNFLLIIFLFCVSFRPLQYFVHLLLYMYVQYYQIPSGSRLNCMLFNTFFPQTGWRKSGASSYVTKINTL